LVHLFSFASSSSTKENSKEIKTRKKGEKGKREGTKQKQNIKIKITKIKRGERRAHRKLEPHPSLLP